MLSCFSLVWFFAILWTVASQADSSVHGILQARIQGVGCHAFLLEIFPTQGSKLHLWCLLHWRAGSLPLLPSERPSCVVTEDLKGTVGDVCLFCPGTSIIWKSWGNDYLGFSILNMFCLKGTFALWVWLGGRWENLVDHTCLELCLCKTQLRCVCVRNSSDLTL